MAFRRFGDRMRVQGRRLVELETVGAKSGSRRQAVVGSFPEIAAAVPSSWVVVASNAGSARHRAWFLNLAKNPDQVWITTAKRRVKVRPETLGARSATAHGRRSLRSHLGTVATSRSPIARSRSFV
jgi:deazaflavin-dependent oxidoreductase (nitroreductase family)